MSLTYLRSRLDELKSQASSLQKRYSRALTDIDSDPSLSPSGKAEAKTSLYTDTKASMSRIRDRRDSLLANEKATLQARINVTSGSSSSDIISFRDAQDRADSIESASDAARIMARALNSNDATLAGAIFRRATEERFLGGAIWSDARRLYTEANPSARDAIQDLSELESLENSSFTSSVQWGVLRP